MLPNCEHEDCNEVLELAEACSGLRFNNMVMMAQIVKKKSSFRSRSLYWSYSLSRFGPGSRATSFYNSSSNSLDQSSSRSRRMLCYWSMSRYRERVLRSFVFV